MGNLPHEVQSSIKRIMSDPKLMAMATIENWERTQTKRLNELEKVFYSGEVQKEAEKYINEVWIPGWKKSPIRITKDGTQFSTCLDDRFKVKLWDCRVSLEKKIIKFRVQVTMTQPPEGMSPKNYRLDGHGNCRIIIPKDLLKKMLVITKMSNRSVKAIEKRKKATDAMDSRVCRKYNLPTGFLAPYWDAQNSQEIYVDRWIDVEISFPEEVQKAQKKIDDAKEESKQIKEQLEELQKKIPESIRRLIGYNFGLGPW